MTYFLRNQADREPFCSLGSWSPARAAASRCGRDFAQRSACRLAEQRCCGAARGAGDSGTRGSSRGALVSERAEAARWVRGKAPPFLSAGTRPPPLAARAASFCVCARACVCVCVCTVCARARLCVSLCTRVCLSLCVRARVSE